MRDIIRRYRGSINPPYKRRDFITLVFTFFVIIALCFTVLRVYAQTTDTTIPTVLIVKPQNAEMVSTGVVPIEATASDDTGIAKVDFHVGGRTCGNCPYVFSYLGTDTEFPYTSTMDTTKEPISTYQINNYFLNGKPVARRHMTLRARAYDLAGNPSNYDIGYSEITVIEDLFTLDGLSPECKVLLPVAYSTVSGVIDVEVEASDNKAVTKVEIYARHRKYWGSTSTNALLDEFTQAQASYKTTLDTTKLPLAYTFDIIAHAYDADGQIGGCTSPITVKDITPPTVSISSPSANSSVSKRTYVPVTIQYSDAYISSIELYVNNKRICAIGNPDPITFKPVTCNWWVPKPNVTYSLQAKGHDSFGNVGVSSIIKVTSK